MGFWLFLIEASSQETVHLLLFFIEMREKVFFPCLIWKNERKLFIHTCNGLYYMNIASKYEMSEYVL